jgi:hypothetical protein
MVTQTLYTCDRCHKQGTELFLKEIGTMEHLWRHKHFKVKAALCHDCQKALDTFLMGEVLFTSTEPEAKQ